MTADKMKFGTKLISIPFILVTVYCGYSLYQTAVNHAYLIETKLKCKLCREHIKIEKSSVYFVNVTFSFYNPSHLTTRVWVIEYSVYIYNKTSQKLDVLGSYSHAGKISDIPPGAKEFINTSVTVTGIYFHRLEWFEMNDPLYKTLIVIDGKFWLKIMPFQEIMIMEIR